MIILTETFLNKTMVNHSMLSYSQGNVARLVSELYFKERISSKKWLNIPAAFDTETSSFIDDFDMKESAIVYVWMFGICGTVIYGRELGEFVELIHTLNQHLITLDSRLIVYIHFAKYDFSFIKYLFAWDKVFLKENRDVLFADYGNIEFRDSLVLSGGQSLENIGKKLRVKTEKAVGNLDYSLIRHSKTPLNDKELYYCEMDIRVLCEYIREKIEDDGDISKIPYTNTGYVRRYVKEQCMKNRRDYIKFMDGLTITPDIYLQATEAYAGGSVSENMAYIDKVCTGVQSYDIKSSYPYVMVAEYFPMSYFTPVNTMVDHTTNWYDWSLAKEYLDNYCCMFELEIWDLEPLGSYYYPISKHKCHELTGGTADMDYKSTAGGRVISAMYVSLTCTELDFETIKKFYKASKYRISRLNIARRGYLPAPIVKSILEFFNKKTTLDGVLGAEREYMISKNMLNSVYGMMVEKVVREILSFENGVGFHKTKADRLMFEQQVMDYSNNKNRVLFYPWGVWVTAHARYRLHDAIYELKDDFRYCDTDSVKFVGNHDAYFTKINKEAQDKIHALAKRLNLPLSYVIPCDRKGEPKCLGVWEKEWDNAAFKTIGAKRYFIRFHDDKSIRKHGKYELTVAGTNKKGTLKFMLIESHKRHCSPFEVFNTECEVPAEYANRTISKFIDKPRAGYVTDYLGNTAWYDALSGVHITPTTYSFSITDEMKDVVIWLTHDGHYVDGLI